MASGETITIDVGRIQMIDKGDYNSATSYTVLDIVYYEGSSYICKKDSKGNNPTNTIYWQLLAKKGDKGDKGNTGATGNGIGSIAKTSTKGLVDTYTITYTNGSTESFTVTNGKEYDDTEIKNQLKDKVDKETGKSLVDDNLISFLNAVNKNYDSDKIHSAIENYFALTPDYGVYGIKFPMWNTSNTSACEKYGANANKTLSLATDTIFESSNYGPAFDTYDCNAEVDNDGEIHVTALKGMNDFKDIGAVDVYVLIRTYYEKWYSDDEGNQHYERTYIPKDGFTPVSQAIRKDGTIRPFFLIAKYVASSINGILYSTKGKAPTRNNSFQNCAINYHKKGTYYSAGLASDYKHLATTLWLKLGTRNSQSILAGNTNNNQQVAVSQTESNVTRVIIPKTTANNIDLYTCISVGDRGSNTNNDRGNGYMHNICDNVMVIGKEEIDSSNTALILDIDNAITTTSTTYVSTMHEISGYSDRILGRNGSVGSNTNCRHGAVLDGIEFMVGGYEVYGNTMMNISDDAGTRELYITNDSSKISNNVATVKSKFNKAKYSIQMTNKNAWNYITEEQLDLENGILVPTKGGQSGSGSAVGYADGCYIDSSSSGEREFLCFGSLGLGAVAGVSCVHANFGVGAAGWSFLARPSICGLGGELAEG